MGDRRERIGCEGLTGEATTIQLKRRQKRVRVHKYCQLAEFGHRWQRGLIAYLATIGSVRRPSSFSCSYSSCNQEQVTQRSIDRSVAERGQQLINGGLSYIYERAARPLLAAVWLIKRWQYGTYGCNPSCLAPRPPPLTVLFLCDLSLFYKACGLHSKALPLLHAAWLAPLQGISFLEPCLTFGPLGLILFVCLCVIFQLIKLIKWANWRFGDLNYVPLRGDLCARRVHKHGA